MTEDITESPDLATFSLYLEAIGGAAVSQSELFKIYLDARVRVGATTSALVADEGKMHSTSARDRFLYHGYCGFTEGHIHDDFAEDVLKHVKDSDFPSFELDEAISDLSRLVEALKELQADFDRLAEVTRTEEPDEDAPEEVYDDWEQNPRYVLPAHARQSEAA